MAMQLVAEVKRELLCKLILASFDLGFWLQRVAKVQSLGRLRVRCPTVDGSTVQKSGDITLSS